MTDPDNLDAQALTRAYHLVRVELMTLLTRYNPPYNSWHEAYAVMLEELEEFWESIRKDALNPDKMELVQVAATALAGIYQMEMEEYNEASR